MPASSAMQSAANNLAESVGRQYDAALAAINEAANACDQGDVAAARGKLDMIRDTVTNIRTAEESVRALASQGVMPSAIAQDAPGAAPDGPDGDGPQTKTRVVAR